jgi:hypothetical protein
MKRFVEGADRGQSTLLPECLDDWIDEESPVRVIDAFVDALDLANLGFDGVEPAATGRPAFHPSVLLKPYIYGYLNRVQSSRRLEREAGRPVTAGSTPSNPSLARSSASTNASMTRTGFSSSIQSSRHSGRSVDCPRSAPSTNRFMVTPAESSGES